MTRGAIKLLGARIDAEPALRAEWEIKAGAVGQGIVGKKLVRWALDRAAAAQVRTTPVARDEAFTCAYCGAEVPLGGRRPRDHCPRCLHSLHVDVVPGDRAATCGGLLVPLGLQSRAGQLDILFRCASCGADRRNRVLDDLTVPDDPVAVRALASRATVPR